MRALRYSAVGAILLCITALVIYPLLPDYRSALPDQRNSSGVVFVDREDRILRIFPDDEGRYTLWREIQQFPESLKLAVMAAEDKRFPYHPGFDPIAVIRAIVGNIRQWKTVSGASTITQQVVRLIRPRPRTYSAKFVELLCAMKMEWQLTKDEILELYLNLSPMGGYVRGAGLAARIYFDKDIGQINLAEAAVLAAIPRSPGRYYPRWARGRKSVLAEKDRILERAAALGWISQGALRTMSGRSVQFRLTQLPLHAPHFVDFVMARRSAFAPLVKTTLDWQLQQSVEKIVRSHESRLARMGIEQAGVLVTSATGEILAMVGSMRYAVRNLGYNNAVLAERSAGSTLKPFLYALALEQGYESTSEIADTFRRYWTPHGDYLPMNADRRYYGPVNLRTALGNSLNISAVKVAGHLGLDEFYHLLERLDVVSNESLSADQYGLGLAIGNIEVSLYRLVQAYGALAREGLYKRITSIEGETTGQERVFHAETTYIINHILADHSARLLTFGNPSWLDFGFPVSIKTGTSSGYRDCWIIGYTPLHVVGVWAGNFGGRPNNGVTGSNACGPLLHDIIHDVYRGVSPPPYERPDSVREELICSMSGKLATPECPYTAMGLVIRHQGKEQDRCSLPHHDTVHHVLGTPYAQWIDRRKAIEGKGRFRLMRPGDTMSSPLTPPILATAALNAPSLSPIEIVSPHERDRFVLSTYRKNLILFRAVPRDVVDHVVWLVDGVEVARTPPPYEMLWEMTRGEHVLHAVTPSRDAARVTFQVE